MQLLIACWDAFVDETKGFLGAVLGIVALPVFGVIWVYDKLRPHQDHTAINEALEKHQGKTGCNN